MASQLKFMSQSLGDQMTWGGPGRDGEAKGDVPDAWAGDGVSPALGALLLAAEHDGHLA